MSYHKDPEVNSAIIRLLDALCNWERDAGRDSTLLLIPHSKDERIVMAQGGKPIGRLPAPDFIFNLAMEERKK